MSTTPLRIWCNMSFPLEAEQLLRDGTTRHELIFSSSRQSSNLTPGQPDPQLAEADIAFGQPDPQIIITLPRLKWVHLTSAGYERYDRDDLRSAFRARRALLTTSSGVYSEPCAQHALAMILALARRLPESLDHQRTDRAWPAASIRARSHLLLGQSALFLGFGAIGRRLAELLTPFQMKLAAVRRTVRGDEAIPTFDESHLDRLLADADHIINILPGGDSTTSFMNAARFQLMKPTAIFYNIGRGGTVDQDALLTALNSGRLAAAYLDVTCPEPLPADHPLWTAPNCFITPHTAGGHHDEQIRIVRHFLQNLESFETGKPIHDRVV